LPYLHILLGITQKHHLLLERHLHELDLDIAHHLAKQRKSFETETKFGQHIKDLQELRALKGEKKLISEGKSPRVSPSMSKTEALKIVQDHIETVEKRELEERTGPLAKSLLNVLKKT
jgi:hypothetical protein